MSTVEILLTKGKVAVVDECDVPLIRDYSWHAHEKRNGPTYAVAWVPDSLPRRKTSMHRVILGAPDGIEVDHKDGNGLNNTRDNIRLCTRIENMRNTRKRNSRSRFKGVAFQKDRPTQPWLAGIFCGKKYNLGRYATEEEAALAYDAAAKRFFGEFAKLNFPEG